MPSFKPAELAWIAEANAKAIQAGRADLLLEARRRLNRLPEQDDPWSVGPEIPPELPAQDDWSAL